MRRRWIAVGLTALVLFSAVPAAGDTVFVASPSVDATSASPNGTTVSSNQTTLQVDVSDPELIAIPADNDFSSDPTSARWSLVGESRFDSQKDAVVLAPAESGSPEGRLEFDAPVERRNWTVSGEMDAVNGGGRGHAVQWNVQDWESATTPTKGFEVYYRRGTDTILLKKFQNGAPTTVASASVSQGAERFTFSISVSKSGLVSVTRNGTTHLTHTIDTSYGGDQFAFVGRSGGGSEGRHDLLNAQFSARGQETSDTVDVVATFNGAEVGTQTIRRNKTVAFDVTPTAGQNTWSVTATDSAGNSVTSQQFSFTGQYDAPEIAFDPADGSRETSYSGQVNVSVEDADMAAGDSVTVTTKNASGGTLSQETLTSNGTVTVPYVADPGENELTVSASDSHGLTTTRDLTFSIPAGVELRNETASGQLVTLPNKTVELRFYFDIGGEPRIVSREVSNGTVNMTGLPANRPFTIVADGEDRYYSRRIFVESLYETQRVFLLPRNQTAAPVVFDVSDYSGGFSQAQSALLVQRAINGSWETVEGDLIGANSRISTQLKSQARHRIVIVNARTGDRRVLGPFTPIAGGTQEVTVTSDSTVRIGGLESLATIGPDIGQLAARQTTISAKVREQDATVTNATLRVWASWPNGTTTTLATASQADAGEVATDVNLEPVANATIMAEATFATESGETGSVGRSWDVQPSQVAEFSLLSTLGQVSTLVPDSSVSALQLAVSLMLTLVLTSSAAAKFRLSTEAVAVVALLQLGTWGALGWLPWTIPFAAGGAALALAAIRRGI
jgi:hypothetical protein